MTLSLALSAAVVGDRQLIDPPVATAQLAGQFGFDREVVPREA